ncbi:hypothetical protein EVAR_54419_1 [Eumeta japonica]|uniref:Zinc finger MYM-type protein 1 n=1 Tax=Eumeta variegata TaxID=151549 RepID=A0A4C1Y969_EUMVA|nr:hypothetical protein EVAR_54419_1 [Eumeta japonica]
MDVSIDADRWRPGRCPPHASSYHRNRPHPRPPPNLLPPYKLYRSLIQLTTVLPIEISSAVVIMSAPRKKLSGAEYRKKAKYKELQGKQCADNMKNWLRRGGDPSVSAATSEVDIELENVSSTLPDQTNQDFSQSDFTVQTSPSLSMCDEQPEQLEKTKPEYERSKSPHLDSDELQKTGFDLTDPGNWPGWKNDRRTTRKKNGDRSCVLLWTLYCIYLQTAFLSRVPRNSSDLITQYPHPSQEVAGKTGEDICQQILEKIAVDDLDIGQCRGQSYDNGSNMASIHKGVQARIAERNELAEFVPCLAHSLNLVEIAKALEEVKQTSRAPEAKYEAGHLLSAIKDFKFILNLTIWANILREINRVNIEIQKEDIILARSVALMDGLLKTLQNMRQNPMEYWIKEAEEVAEKVVLTLFCKTNEFETKAKWHYLLHLFKQARHRANAMPLSGSFGCADGIRMRIDLLHSSRCIRFGKTKSLDRPKK